MQSTPTASSTWASAKWPMRHLAMTGMETASMMARMRTGSAIRAMPPAARMSAGTFSKAMTVMAPASSAIRASSGVVTSMMTPPLRGAMLSTFFSHAACRLWRSSISGTSPKKFRPTPRAGDRGCRSAVLGAADNQHTILFCRKESGRRGRLSPGSGQELGPDVVGHHQAFPGQAQVVVHHRHPAPAPAVGQGIPENGGRLPAEAPAEGVQVQPPEEAGAQEDHRPHGGALIPGLVPLGHGQAPRPHRLGVRPEKARVGPAAAAPEGPRPRPQAQVLEKVPYRQVVLCILAVPGEVGNLVMVVARRRQPVHGRLVHGRLLFLPGPGQPVFP